MTPVALPEKVPPTSVALSPQQREELALARTRSKAIRKAARVASFNGWVTGIIAAMSAPFAIFSVVGFIVAVGLAVVAYNEFRGRKRLLAHDPAAASLLGWNQVGLLTLIVAYCVWMIVTGLGSFAAQMQAQPELAAAIGEFEGFDELFNYFVVGFYGTVILLTVIFQGMNAYYYFTRRKFIVAYLQETPAWVQEVERMTSVA